MKRAAGVNASENIAQYREEKKERKKAAIHTIVVVVVTRKKETRKFERFPSTPYSCSWYMCSSIIIV